MSQTTLQKGTSLAIDALTQFRCGIERIRIGPIEVKAVEAFNWVTRYQKPNLTDEDNLIEGIRQLIFNRLAVFELNKDKSKFNSEFVYNLMDELSVEYVGGAEQ